MPIHHIFAHLVYPNHDVDLETPYTASEIPLDGKLFGMLKEVYDGSPVECIIDVKFRAEKQQNDVRDLILNLIQEKDATAAGAIAERLAACTTRRSKLGLFFVVVGEEDGKHSVLFSRFPTDQAILADDGEGGLNVEFLEKVFVKKWSSYKGAYFIDSVGKSGFWEGKVVDRQINAPTGEASKYWVENFLDAEFVTTSHLGTKRFAKAMSGASRESGSEGRQEINSLVPFLKQFDGQHISVSDIVNKVGVSEESKDKIKRGLPHETYDQVFTFDFDSFRNMISFRTMTLDNGVSVTADSAEFKDLVAVAEGEEKGVVTLSASGKLIGDQLRKAR